MAKVTIQVEDILKYETDIVIEQPSYMSDEELETHLDDATKKAETAQDLEHVFERMGFTVVETTTGFPNSPDSMEMEIIDVREVKEDSD